MSQSQRLSPRPGFTLLEVLIALSLVTALMALGWSLFATFTRLETRARRTVAGLEITRSFQRQLQDDLDQVVNFSMDPAGATSSGSVDDEVNAILSDSGIASGVVNSDQGRSLLARSSSLSQADRSTVLDRFQENGVVEYEYLKQAFFDGDSQSLTFLIPGISTKDQGVQFGESVVVNYQWKAQSIDEPSDSPRDEFDEELPTGANNASLGRGSNNAEQNTNRVFVRRVMTLAKYRQEEKFSFLDKETNLEGFETIEVGRNSADIERNKVDDREIVDELPEISDISFRYFDGRSWKSSWISSRETIPVAVEVVFKIKADDRRQQQDSSEETNESELELGSEIEIGFADQFEMESERRASDEALLDINPDFDPESIRIVIRVGTRGIDADPSSEMGNESTELNSFLDFENGGRR